MLDLCCCPAKEVLQAGGLRGLYLGFVKNVFDSLAMKSKCPLDFPIVSVYVGDNYEKLHRRTLVKARLANDTRGVLLPMNYKRHWQGLWAAVVDDVPYDEKSDQVVWRGSTTGYGDLAGNRFDFMRWCVRNPRPWLDVGFTNIVQGQGRWAVSSRGGAIDVEVCGVTLRLKPRLDVSPWELREGVLPACGCVGVTARLDATIEGEVHYRWSLPVTPPSDELSRRLEGTGPYIGPAGDTDT